MRADWKSVFAGVLLLYGVEKVLNAVNYTITNFNFGFEGPGASIVLAVLALVIAYLLVKGG